MPAASMTSSDDCPTSSRSCTIDGVYIPRLGIDPRQSLSKCTFHPTPPRRSNRPGPTVYPEGVSPSAGQILPGLVDLEPAAKIGPLTAQFGSSFPETLRADRSPLVPSRALNRR